MIILKGDPKWAYRDPACFYHNGIYHLFFTVSERSEGYLCNRIGMSTSIDLSNWSEPRFLTERNKLLNFSRPGNVIEYNGEFILCITSYPMPEPYEKHPWADETARLFIMRTKNFVDFSSPEQLYPKGDTENSLLGRMIDPYILKDNDEFKLFFKQNGVSLSVSRDLVHWDYKGHVQGGENACVIKKDNKFILIHSPSNGIGFMESDDLVSWRDIGQTTLKQDEWEWAKGRITAGFVLEAPDEFSYKYILFFHGSSDDNPETHGYASLALAFSDDLKTFVY